MSGWTVRYASNRYDRLTKVVFPIEATARDWFSKIQLWSDIMRVQLVGPDGARVGDETIPHRIELEEHRLVAAQLDGDVAGPAHIYRGEAAIQTIASRGVFVTNERCRCKHSAVEHVGIAGAGKCTMCLCERFSKGAR